MLTLISNRLIKYIRIVLQKNRHIYKSRLFKIAKIHYFCMKLYILAFTHTETDGNFTFKMPTTNQDSNQGSRK